MKRKKITRSALAVLLLLGVVISGGGIRAFAAEGDVAECSVGYSSRIWELFFGGSEEYTQAAENERLVLIPGGGVFGAKIHLDHVEVGDAGDVRGILAGDIILKVNGREVDDCSDVISAVEKSGGKEITLTILRDGNRIEQSVKPSKVGEEWRLGILLRDSAAGIGTITYVNPETGEFGGLGHGICGSESKDPVSMTNGEVTGVILGGVQKGESGKPGELSGILTSRISGRVCANTECGVFGVLTEIPEGCEAVAVAERGEVHTGEACIYSTVKRGACRKYSIEITEIDRYSTGNKSFKIKVTDPTLIALTGGIVRGMSGSPIIQNGKLVGAVTHVMVADPTEGYGIFIENMLNAANQQAQPKAA